MSVLVVALVNFGAIPGVVSRAHGILDGVQLLRVHLRHGVTRRLECLISMAAHIEEEVRSLSW